MCAHANVVRGRPGCARIGACALIRTNKVIPLTAGVFLCCWRLMYVFLFLVKFRYPNVYLFGKKAAHSACDMFSWYKYMSLFPPRFLEWESFSDCAFS